jgi:hypothetical protein
MRTPPHVIRAAAEIIAAGEAGPVSLEALGLIQSILQATAVLNAEIERRLVVDG